MSCTILRKLAAVYIEIDLAFIFSDSITDTVFLFVIVRMKYRKAYWKAVFLSIACRNWIACLDTVKKRVNIIKLKKKNNTYARTLRMWLQFYFQRIPILSYFFLFISCLSKVILAISGLKRKIKKRFNILVPETPE